MSTEEKLEDLRRAMLRQGVPASDLAKYQGEVWDTESLQRDFDVKGFMAPFVMVERRSDGTRGTLEFVHSPRVYFAWQPD